MRQIKIKRNLKTKRNLKRHYGGFLGFGTSKNNKLKTVISVTYKKILEYRVNQQVRNNQTINKLTQDIIKLDKDCTNLATNIQTKSQNKTDLYNSYLRNNKWSKVVTNEEQKQIAELAVKQRKELDTSYTNTSKTEDSLANRIVQQIINVNTKSTM